MTIVQDVARDCAEHLRSACFDQADSPYVLLGDNLEILDRNQRANCLLDGMVVYQDREGRLAVAGDRGSAQLRKHAGLALARGSARTLFQLTPRVWLEVEFCRVLTDGISRVLVAPRLIDLDTTPNIQAVTRLFGLTVAESAILSGIAEALRPKEIANRMDISVHTVRAHLRSIYAKMGVNSAIEAQKIITILEIS